MAAKLGLTHNLIKGRKFNRSHTTVVEDAVPIIRAAGNDHRVTKVRLGFIDGKGRGHPRVEFTGIHGGLKIVVHGSNGGQELYVYTRSPADVQKKLQDIWSQYR